MTKAMSGGLMVNDNVYIPNPFYHFSAAVDPHEIKLHLPNIFFFKMSFIFPVCYSASILLISALKIDILIEKSVQNFRTVTIYSKPCVKRPLKNRQKRS